MIIFDNKIDKKTFISKSIIYILAITTFFAFWDFLGADNAFVGVAIVHGATMLFDTDLTVNPFKNIAKFFVIYLYIGIFPFLASLNIYIGFFINFFALFFITYSLVYDLKKSIWAPFVLGYLFLLINPIPVTALPKRLLGLSLGSLFLVLTQLIINKNKSQNKLRKTLKLLVGDVSNKINLLIENEKLDKSDSKVSTYIETIVNTINERKSTDLCISNIDNIRLNFSLYIERLNYSLYDLEHNLDDDLYRAFLLDLSLLLQDLLSFIEDDKADEKLILEIELFTSSYQKLLNYNYSAFEIIQNMAMLKFSIKNFNDSKIKDKSLLNLNTYLSLPKKLKFKNMFKLNFTTTSLRFTYAFRLSFLISVSCFVVGFFKIPFGNWITITLYAVVQPYAENSRERFTQRFIGTVGGIALFVVITLAFHSPYIKIILFLALYYIYMFLKDYDKKIICITAIVLGVFFMMGKNPYETIFYRFLFMTLGIFIGYLGTKYIMPFDNKTALRNFTSQYYKLSEDMLRLGLNHKCDYELLEKLSDKIFISKLLEDKIILNNSNLDYKIINQFVYNQRTLNNNIYFLFFYLYNLPNKDELIKEFKSKLKFIYKTNITEEYNEEIFVKELKEKIKTTFDSLEDPTYKIISINIYRILLRFKISNSLENKIRNSLN
ncbi:FUSC family protein [Clostridium massiliamazoniense]|uniref:FUSC family protein n=1 Tax=Clostridium massiliamazoniense TaxID=1347366 RepID=UPI0006D774CC|nr:FUSC family protein [Clostridium massiliamazoniense]